MSMDKLEALLDLTRRVQALVEEGKWQQAAEIEKGRRPLVEAFLGAEPDAAARQAASDVIEKVVAIDARMIERMGKQRAEALDELRRETSTGRAAREYLANAPAVIPR